MYKNHSVIIIPGLGDEVRILQRVTHHWRKSGLEPIVHSVGWCDGENEFQPKLKRLLKMIDQLAEKSNRVSLVGTSAGGSAVLNAFVQRRNKIYRIINICGRLRTGIVHGFRSFKSRTASSPAFAQSVKMAEKNEKEITNTDKQRIMTVRALFGDELVPANTCTVRGAYNIVVPTPEHVLSIGVALTVFSRPLIRFLQGKN